jgi:hypothetical protein
LRAPRRLLVVLVALVSLLLVLAGVATADVNPPPLAGTFRYAGDAQEEIARQAAIDRSVERLFFAIRPIARWRLSSTTKVVPWFSVTVADGKIKARGAEGFEMASPLDGTAVPLAWRGEHFQLSQRFQGPVLVQTMATEDGAGHTEWTLSPDGTTLTGKFTITSPHLSLPIAFKLTYKRTS